ncbi:hypothetical protein OH407_23590, partial [Salmonella enterica]|uniref:sacsin N-terminal ATP-binding-like domain-containing protein n=1 Tax=Salmonella enterica TaxID=28901 RepID=UPI0022B7535A
AMSLLELIQNADDARASVVKLVVDLRRHGTRSLLADSMAPWQTTPAALLIYNDAMMSPTDFERLTSIGQSSKLERLSATGRFGLGACAMYHITDV